MEQNYLDNLTPQQLDVVKHFEGVALVVSGPGSGKTACATRRIVHLIKHYHVSPHHIVAITFTNKAANEMKERIRLVLPKSVADVLRVSTFHSFCAHLLRKEHDAAALPKGYTICDDSDSKAYVVQSIALEIGEDPKKVSGLKDHRDPKKVVRYISDKKQNLLLAADVFDALDENSGPNDLFYAKVYLRYEAALKKTRSLDFDDLIMRTVLMLRSNTDVLERYAKDIHHILVDESQDTNTSQYELVRQLGGVHKNIFLIGDTDQSIYRWRGAQPENLTRLENDYPDLKVYFLEENFRSTHQIADVANHLIDNNSGRKPKKIKARVDGTPVRCIECLDAKQEAAFITDEIVTEIRRNAASWKDFAILYRMHTKSRVFEEMMVTNNVPHRIIGGVGFYNRSVVKDIIAYLKLLVNPADDVSFIRIYNKPARGFGETSYAKVYNLKEEQNVPILHVFKKRWYADVLKGSSLAGAHKIREVFKTLHSLPRDAVAPLVEGVIKASGYLKALESERDAKAIEKVELLEELLTAAKEFDETHAEGLLRFIEWTSLMQSTDKDTEEDRVYLMTCHAAKGLEFKRLYVVGVVDGVMPIDREADDYGNIKSPEQRKADIEEERRVFFVALTRAERHLTITHTREEFRYNSVIECTPSRFLEELEDTVTHDSIADSSIGGYLISAMNKKKGGWKNKHNEKNYGNKRRAKSVGRKSSNYGRHSY
jgi:DNA helicase-2/ATP-dependent DNA helicase PcrA